jgi:hypothetical protein
MGIELPVGLGSRAAYGWAFSEVEDPKLDAAKIGNSAHQAIQSIDFPNQMTFSESTNGRITRHRANGAKPVGYQDRFCAHASGRGRGLTASVAAADHCDVESVHHQNPGWRLIAKARGGVKIIGFIENVSRETFQLIMSAPKPTTPQACGKLGHCLQTSTDPLDPPELAPRRSFPDTEVAENHIENIVDVNAAGEAA